MNEGWNIQGNEKVQIILNLLGREGQQLMQKLNDKEWDNCKTSMGLFEILSEKFKPQPN